MAHLVLSELDRDTDAQFFSAVFAEFVRRVKNVAVVIMNPFDEQQLAGLLGVQPSGVLLGYDTYLVRDPLVWEKIVQIRAEWVAFAPIEGAAVLAEISSRLTEKVPSWWKFAATRSDIGALASETDLANPLGVYFPSSEVVELFGSYEEIFGWFRAVSGLTSDAKP